MDSLILSSLLVWDELWIICLLVGYLADWLWEETTKITHRIHGAGIYANIWGILMGSMLPYMAAPWILWVMGQRL